MELFREKGYEGTTVEEIAQRAELTPRTFFRYFPDKREVLFWGTERFETRMVEGVLQEASPDPLVRVMKTLGAVAADYFDARASAVRLRRSIIQSSPELQEREGQKMVRVAARLTEVLVGEGLEAKTAALAVELGILVFRRAFDEWAEASETTLVATIQDNFVRIRAMALGSLT